MNPFVHVWLLGEDLVGLVGEEEGEGEEEDVGEGEREEGRGGGHGVAWREEGGDRGLRQAKDSRGEISKFQSSRFLALSDVSKRSTLTKIQLEQLESSQHERKPLIQIHERGRI